MRYFICVLVALLPFTRVFAQPHFDTSALKPLTEMADTKYHDFEGGLYPGGKNDRPAEHEVAGVKFARSVQPLDADGKPSPDGAIVLLSIGMSNTTQEFSALQRLASMEKHLKPHLKLIDGAQGGMTAAMISQPKDPRGARFWETVSNRLQQSGATAQQVQAMVKGWLSKP